MGEHPGAPARSLRSVYGDNVELQAEGESSLTFRILAELETDGRHYAILQSSAMRSEGDIEVMRLLWDEDGEPSLETVEDDDEWESAAEAYDDLLFGGEERP